jgi:hypothetical protein
MMGPLQARASSMPTPSTAKWPKPRSEDEFEDIVVDFLRIRWKDPNAQRHGRRGQRQHGVDVVGHPGWLKGGTACGQCKNTETLSLADIIAEVEKAKTFPGGLAEFYVVTSGDRDVPLQTDVREHFKSHPAAFHVEVVFWLDVVADISVDDDLVAKHWRGFGSNTVRKHFLLIQAEAQRMKEHGERLLADLACDRWKQSLPDKFRPLILENASIEAMSEIASDQVLHRNLNSLRVAAAAADEKTDRILQELPLLGPFQLHPYDRLNEIVLRVTNEAHHVVRGIDRLLAK